MDEPSPISRGNTLTHVICEVLWYLRWYHCYMAGVALLKVQCINMRD